MGLFVGEMGSQNLASLLQRLTVRAMQEDHLSFVMHGSTVVGHGEQVLLQQLVLSIGLLRIFYRFAET